MYTCRPANASDAVVINSLMHETWEDEWRNAQYWQDKLSNPKSQQSGYVIEQIDKHGKWVVGFAMYQWTKPETKQSISNGYSWCKQDFDTAKYHWSNGANDTDLTDLKTEKCNTKPIRPYTINTRQNWPKLSTCFIHIIAIALYPNCRGKGLGSKLMKSLIDSFPIKTRFGLEVETTNKGAIRCYQKCKFEIKRTVKNYYGLEKHGYKMVLIRKTEAELINEIIDISNIKICCVPEKMDWRKWCQPKIEISNRRSCIHNTFVMNDENKTVSEMHRMSVLVKDMVKLLLNSKNRDNKLWNVLFPDLCVNSMRLKKTFVSKCLCSECIWNLFDRIQSKNALNKIFEGLNDLNDMQLSIKHMMKICRLIMIICVMISNIEFGAWFWKQNKMEMLCNKILDLWCKLLVFVLKMEQNDATMYMLLCEDVCVMFGNLLLVYIGKWIEWNKISYFQTLKESQIQKVISMDIIAFRIMNSVIDYFDGEENENGEAYWMLSIKYFKKERLLIHCGNPFCSEIKSFRNRKDFKMCKCQRYHYCNRHCQKIHWNNSHSVSCCKKQ